MTKYAKHMNPVVTPQTEQAKDNQVMNSAGGFSFKLDQWSALDRWLVLGAEGGTYYASEKKLVTENAKTIKLCLTNDGPRTVSRIVEMSQSGRAPKNDPAIFALAIAASHDNEKTRKAALEALPSVCRTGTHLFQFAESVNSMRGWGRGLKNAVASWYNDKSADSVAFQAIKYQQRNGWSHGDLLRLAHPQAASPEHEAVFRYIITGTTDTGERNVKRKGSKVESKYSKISAKVPEIIEAYEVMKKTKSLNEVVRLINDHRMTHEMVTNEWKDKAEVWEALLQHMPMTAMVRNLGKMSSIGLLQNMSSASKTVIEKLKNNDDLRKSRIHPITLLSALTTYQQGRGVKGSLTWNADKNISKALENAFYEAFKTIEPTGKRIMIGLDVSSSMTCGDIAGASGLTPRMASAVMSMVTMRAEQQYYVKGFSHNIVDVNIDDQMRINEVIKKIESIPMGGTDCSLPMIHAAEKKIPVDAFYVYTDNETYYGKMHPFQALKMYRSKMGIPAKLVVVGFTATDFSIADPSDGGMLDVVGFDSAAPSIMADFTR